MTPTESGNPNSVSRPPAEQAALDDPPHKSGREHGLCGPQQTRRGILQTACRWAASVGFALLGAAGALWAAAVARFMLPNALCRGRRRLKVGFPRDFPRGSVDGRFCESHGIWIVHGRYAGKWQITALSARCTHLGCMVRWQAEHERFQCPCHGSSFSREGINLTGPAPRPLVRCAIRIAEDGRLEVDPQRTFQEELGQWNDPASYVSVERSEG